MYDLFRLILICLISNLFMYLHVQLCLEVLAVGPVGFEVPSRITVPGALGRPEVRFPVIGFLVSENDPREFPRRLTVRQDGRDCLIKEGREKQSPGESGGRK